MRVFSHTFGAKTFALGQPQDFFEVIPGAGQVCRLLGYKLCNQGGVADAGDAQEEDIRLQVIAGLATSGSGGVAGATSKAVDRGTAATRGVSVSTVETNNTTVAVVGGGETCIMDEGGWNVRVEYQMFYPDEMVVMFSTADSRLVIRGTNGPADDITIGGTVWYAEL